MSNRCTTIRKAYSIFFISETGLWAGYETAMLLSVSPAMTFYLSHLFTRVALPKASQEKPSSWQTFFVNAAGNATSTAILFPLILSKTRLQWRSPSGRKMYKNLLDVLRKTIRKYGFAGEIKQRAIEKKRV